MGFLFVLSHSRHHILFAEYSIVHFSSPQAPSPHGDKFHTITYRWHGQAITNVQAFVLSCEVERWYHLGRGGGHKTSACIGLSLVLIVTLCGCERVLVVSTEPLDDLCCLTTPESPMRETVCCPCC